MRLVILGTGQMGEALARGLVQGGLVAPDDLVLTDVIAARAQSVAQSMGARTATDNRAAAAEADLVIIAVKPPHVADLCADIAPALPAGAILLSIAAGVTLRRLARAVDRDDIVLARAMPNTPCLVGVGAIGLSVTEAASPAVRETLCSLLGALGVVEEVPESLLDAVTGLAGSGPAFVAVLIEALADGGVLMGLPRAQAQRLALQTVRGTAVLLQETGQHPAQAKDAVSSPGGTTIAGLVALEEAGGRAAVIAAVRAAARRARELADE